MDYRLHITTESPDVLMDNEIDKVLARYRLVN